MSKSSLVQIHCHLAAAKMSRADLDTFK